MRNKKFVCILLLLVGCQNATKPQGLTVQVKQVTSGQTIEVVSKGKTMLVRLIGIDAPNMQQQPHGQVAKNSLAQVIANKQVILEFDEQKQDEFGRYLAYVWSDLLVNEYLVKQGVVLVAMKSPNHKYDTRLVRAQEWARLQEQGIWNAKQPMTLTPAEFRAQYR
ncbi:thermonuclease family protein [Synechocystis sp. PCC 7509]|uniref:thermonuclease family protein n=1 Tax=Synechocystis sp. PCC 7509 TaxID=927677 RepID=UPI0002AD090A|nr:thermonuclease family protein [Synechocystis sp. PCC 7509]